MRLLIFLVLLFCFLLSGINCVCQNSGCTDAESIKKGELTNLFKISDHIYRSEQPGSADWGELAGEGIVTVINLRHGNTDVKANTLKRLNYIHLPMKAYCIKYEKMVECLKLINKSGGASLVHCLHGSDRTGCVIACCRMVFCGWTREKAIDEFLQEKFGYHHFWFPGIKKFLEEVDIEKLKKDVLM